LGGGRRGGGLSKMRKEGRLNGLNRKYQFWYFVHSKKPMKILKNRIFLFAANIYKSAGPLLLIYGQFMTNFRGEMLKNKLAKANNNEPHWVFLFASSFSSGNFAYLCLVFLNFALVRFPQAKWYKGKMQKCASQIASAKSKITWNYCRIHPPRVKTEFLNGKGICECSF
jgi:hypothetical protein